MHAQCMSEGRFWSKTAAINKCSTACHTSMCGLSSERNPPPMTVCFCAPAGKSSFDVQLPATYEVLNSAVNTSLVGNVAAGSHRLVSLTSLQQPAAALLGCRSDVESNPHRVPELPRWVAAQL